MIYFISDTHFNHANIIKYCNRPFKYVEEMNETLIDNWNNTIKESDTIYHLGDLALGKSNEIKGLVNRLIGKKYLIRGNHDRWSVSFYEELGFEVLKFAPIKLDEYKLILSHVPIPDKIIPKGYINLHGHIHDKKLEDCTDSYIPKMYSKELHFNVSADAIRYKPISIEQIRKEQNHI